MATPLIRALGERHPEAELDVLVSSLAAPILEHHPLVRRIETLQWRNLPYVISLEKQRLVRRLRESSYDFGVLLERASHYRALLERAAIGDIRSFRQIAFDPNQHAIENNLRVAGIDPSTVSHDMEISLTKSDRSRAEELLTGLERPRVGIHLGYGPRGKKNQSVRLKGWPLGHFVRLSKSLAERGAALVFTGSEKDREDVSRVAPDAALDLSGRTTVRELGAVIENLELFISVDSGPAHLAAALGTPLIVLWGPAIYEQVRPVSSKSAVRVLRHSVPCAPCYETPLMKSCRRNVCMEGITPEVVLDAVSELLGKPA
jgi:ADP-heptose:LPS heptosyltransferase